MDINEQFEATRTELNRQAEHNTRDLLFLHNHIILPQILRDIALHNIFAKRPSKTRRFLKALSLGFAA